MSDRLSGADLQRFAGWKAPGVGLDARAVLPVMPVIVESPVKAELAVAPRMNSEQPGILPRSATIFDASMMPGSMSFTLSTPEYSPRPSPQPFAGLPQVR